MEFLDLLKDNKEEDIKKHLIQYGKAPKPHAPFYFELKEEPNGRSTINAGTNETDSGNNN